MPYNLLADPLFPVVRRSGRTSLIRFTELTVADDPPVDFCWPRPDFNIASYEFCIGVLSVALSHISASNTVSLEDLWGNLPTAEDLASLVQDIVPFFNLDGDGPLFMQDYEAFSRTEANDIDALLIDTPGVNGQNKNADLLTHRHRYPAMGRAAAAMALYALQQFAPSGGAGNRTSMRGGGPLTTLIIPGANPGNPSTLWHRIIINVSQNFFSWDDPLARPERVFPWVAPTLVSDKEHGEREVSEHDSAVHSAHAYFGMPRRIRLVFSNEQGFCPLTGAEDRLVTGFSQQPWGMNYGVWRHPLTPYRRQKESDPPYSVKPKSGRFGYRDWVSVTFGQNEGKGALALPALNVEDASGDRANMILHVYGSSILRVAGWAMSNMEAMSYLWAEQPLYLTDDKILEDRLRNTAIGFANAGDAAHIILRSALREALFSDSAKPSLDAGLFDESRMAFYENTERAFHRALASLLEKPDQERAGLARSWLKEMQKVAGEIFQRVLPAPGRDPTLARRMALAHGHMMAGFSGWGKAGERLFTTLQLPLPEKKAAKAKTKTKTKEKKS